MCDWIDGEMLLAFGRDNMVAQELVHDLRQGLFLGLRHLESLEERLADMALPATEYPVEFHRLSVPIGEELWAVAKLSADYQRRLADVLTHGRLWPAAVQSLLFPSTPFTVAPHGLLHLAVRWPFLRPAPAPIAASDFVFSPLHATNKADLQLPSTPPADAGQVRIAILDSGIAADVLFPIVTERNFVDPLAKTVSTDYLGHGTAIAMIIHDLIPDAQISVLKVADDVGRASEWDTIAGLAGCQGQHLINMSLAFGLAERACKQCGRESHSSRSAVFEAFITQLQGQTQQPIVVAAAGNDRDDTDPVLQFPARYGSVVAVSAINSRKELSDFSNWGPWNATETLHDHRYVLPGGDATPGAEEGVGQFDPSGEPLAGTSFAAAYASGVIGNIIADIGVAGLQTASVLDALQHRVNNTFTTFNATEHGNGLMQY